MEVEVTFTPAEFEALAQRDLRDAGCVVFDVLRATSTAVVALACGARGIRPVATIEEALECRRRNPAVLLAGERAGRRIGAALTGGVEFDLGNSPFEFTAERVAGRTLVQTTTNGTRALRASATGGRVLAGAFLNLAAVAAAIGRASWRRLLLVCSGTGEAAAGEDTLAAGALCDRLGKLAELTDSARIALGFWRSAGGGWRAEAAATQNARRLLAIPELAADVEFCLRTDVFGVVPELNPEGELVVR